MPKIKVKRIDVKTKQEVVFNTIGEVITGVTY